MQRKLDEASAGLDTLALDPEDVMGLARAFVATHGWTFYRHQKLWWLWDRSRYRPLNQERLEAELWKWIEEAGAFPPKPSVVNGTIKALMAIGQAPPNIDMPCWLGTGDWPDPRHVIAFTNGLLDVSGDESRLLEHTPKWFSATCLPHPYDPDAECPTWEKFLYQVFNDDEECVRALQQWFGYNLTSDVSQHKLALLVGPPRSGKSTVLGVLGQMLGEENVATPTLATLRRFYGLETIVGKMAALVGDAHLENASKAITILERLKSIVGGDRQNVDRKGRGELANVAVRARFTIAVNELPQFPDSASALRSRLLVIPLPVSFEGREDRRLGERLSAEMPGIVAWSLRGLRDLRRSPGLLQPEAGRAILEEFVRLGSPIKQFLEERCDLSPEALVGSESLYAAYRSWCLSNGYRPENSSRFGAMLRASHSGIERVRKGRDARGRQVYHYRGVGLARAGARTRV